MFHVATEYWGTRGCKEITFPLKKFCFCKKTPSYHINCIINLNLGIIMSNTSNILILKIVDAVYIEGYTLRLTFNNGEIRLCDFTPMMKKGICTKLQDINYFRSFKLDPFSVDWNNEIGFAPEFLYKNSTLLS